LLGLPPTAVHSTASSPAPRARLTGRTSRVDRHHLPPHRLPSTRATAG